MAKARWKLSASSGGYRLTAIAPSVVRAIVLRDPAVASGPGRFAAIQAVAPSLGVELRPVDVRGAGEIERAIVAFAQNANSGMIVTGLVSLATSMRPSDGNRRLGCGGGPAALTPELTGHGR